MRRWWPVVAAGLFLAVFFWLPLARILSRAAAADFGVLPWPVIWFTTWQALATSVICLVLGLPVAFAVSRLQWFGQRAVSAILGVPFVLPTVVTAIAFRPLQDWISFGSSRTVLIGWIIFAHVFYNLSLVVRIVGISWQQINPDLVEEATLSGVRGWQLFRFVYFPELRNSIKTAFALTFLFAWTSFGAVLLMGQGKIASVETQIWQSVVAYLDFNTASALALIQTLVTSLVFWSTRGAGFVPASTLSNFVRTPVTKTWHRCVIGYVFALVAALIVLPTFGLVVAVGSRAANFSAALFTQTGSDNTLAISLSDALANSLINATLVGLLAVGLALALGWYANNELSSTQSRWLSVLTSMPLGVSAVVLGLGYLVTFDSSWGALRASSLLVVLAQSTIALPFAFALLDASWRKLDRNQVQAAQSMGANRLQSLRLVQLPHLRPALLNALALSFLISLGDFGAASFIATGDKATLTTTLYRLISRPGAQNYDLALLTALLFIGVIYLVLYLASVMETKSRRG